MTTSRLERHYQCLRKFTDKVIVVVYGDDKLDTSQASDVYERFNGLGFSVFLHQVDDDQFDVSTILYCEFDTEDEAALFKLRYM